MRRTAPRWRQPVAGRCAANVDDDTVLMKLEDLARALDIVIRYEPTEDGRSGVCRLRGVKTVIIHSGLPTGARISALVDALAKEDTEGIYLPPVIREMLERR